MHAATIASDGYQAHAIVAAESFLRQNPGSRFTVVTVECDPAPFVERDLNVLQDVDLGLDDASQRRRRYNAFEYATSLKPTVLKMLLNRSHQAILLDADVYSVGSFDGLSSAFGDGEVLLTPHLRVDLPDDGLWPSATSILTVGVINSGFVAARRGQHASAFLDWWERRLISGCRDLPKRGLYVDQRWLDLALTMLPGLTLSRGVGWNLGHWNLLDVDLVSAGDHWIADGEMLCAFHFSGFDPHRPRSLSRHQNRIAVEAGSALAALCQQYAGALLRADYDSHSNGRVNNHAARSLGHRLMPVARVTAPIRARFGRV